MYEVKRVAIVRLGIISGALYAIGGFIEALLFLPMTALMAVMPHSASTGFPPVFGLFTFVVFPIAGAAIGFIGGAIGGWLYNVITRWTGGLQFMVSPVMPPDPAVAPSPW